MNNYPRPIQNLIDEFNKFPNIGQKTAERFVFYLLDRTEAEINKFIQFLKDLEGKITLCSICFNFSEKTPCHICSDPRRNHGIICVIAKPQDLQAIEKTGEYQGVYHILGGTIDNLENKNAEKLKIKELINRIKNSKTPVQEIIFGFNPDISGETTVLYLTKLLKQFNPKIKLTRLARGLPLGSNLEYADQITIINALKDRKEI